MPIEDLTEIDKAYLAGLVDGEGSILLARKSPSKNGRTRYEPRVITTLCTPEPLHYFKEQTNLGFIHTHNAQKYNRRHSPSYQWTILTRQAEAFLKAIYPYLKIKRDQAEVILLFYQLLNHNHGRWNCVSDEESDMQEIYHLALRVLKKNAA